MTVWPCRREKHSSPERVHLLIMESGFPLSEKSLKAMAVISILFPVRNPFSLELQYRCKNCFLRRIQIRSLGPPQTPASPLLLVWRTRLTAWLFAPLRSLFLPRKYCFIPINRPLTDIVPLCNFYHCHVASFFTIAFIQSKYRHQRCHNIHTSLKCYILFCIIIIFLS